MGEYGGNTLGYGSRSVLGGGWPGDVMKVDGDTVTVTFEMRSGREHNTPDRALWGFRLSVRAQECEDTSCIQPATSDIALTLAEVISYSLEVITQQSKTHIFSSLHFSDDFGTHFFTKSRQQKR